MTPPLIYLISALVAKKPGSVSLCLRVLLPVRLVRPRIPQLDGAHCEAEAAMMCVLMTRSNGAAVSIVMSCLTSHITSVYPLLTYTASTADGNSLSVSGQGELEPLSIVLISDTIQYNGLI